jgi:DtxR family Mn-dependent transcriptional regulator
MRLAISSTLEEYLEHIYRLEYRYGVAKTKQLAERVGVSLGTVTNTIDVLKQKQLVLHEPYKGVKLTKTGRRIALQVLRRHRLSECLLTNILDVDWSKAHYHACRFEHVVTEGLTSSLAKALGYPKTCPHGNPIPTSSGLIPKDASQPLTSLNNGERGIIVKIIDEKEDVLQYLMTLNIIPGTPIEVVEQAPFQGPITLAIDNQKVPISRELASIVWIQKVE